MSKNKIFSLTINKLFRMRSPVFPRFVVSMSLLVLCFTDASAQDIQDAKSYTKQGDEFLFKSKYEEAIVFYNKAIGIDANYSFAYYKRGFAFTNKKEADSNKRKLNLNMAIQDFSKAISLHPDSSIYYFQRGETYRIKKIADSALLDYSKAINMDTKLSGNYPRAKRWYQTRGDLYQQKRQYESAISDYTILISLDSNNADFFRQRSKAYYMNNQVDLALQDVLRDFSNDTALYKNNNYRGLSYNSLGKYESSVLEFLTYIIKIPDHGNPYISIISPLVRLKRFDEAALFYKLYAEKKNYKEQNARYGDKKFESFLNQDLYKFYTYYITAVKQVADNKLENALTSLDSASKVYGTEPKDETKRLYVDILSLSGYVLEKLGRYEEAKVNYDQSLLIDVKQPELAEALESLQKKMTLTRSGNKKPVEIKISTANVQKQKRGFTIEADKDNSVLKVQLIGEVKDESGLDSLKINGFAATVDGGVFFANLTLKPDVTSLLITAYTKQKDSTSKIFDLNDFTNNKFSAPVDSAALAQKAGKYYAILIAAKDYADPSWQDLRTPIRDANKLRDILINQYTFDSTNVDTLYNRSREDIIEAIIARGKKMTTKDNLLIFYAGHGDTTIDIMGKVDGYLVPSSTKSHSTPYYISSEDIFKALLRSPAKHILILLDACYSGTFTRSQSPEVPNDIEMQRSLDSRKVMSSGNVEEVPDDSEFILYLTEYLKNNTQEKYVSTKEVWEDVSKKIKSTLAQYEPIGKIWDKGGQFIFEKRKK